MIEKKYGKYVLVCDLCYKEYGSFDTFQDTVKGKKDYEWTSIKMDGEWIDICPEHEPEEFISFPEKL